tara:strand:+ start:519 stop:986 length:468 start_codon:yes stop_codon:yes gene_type:complete
MSHFVGLVIVPKDEVTVNKKHDQDDRYSEAFSSDYADRLLMDYWEGDTGYGEFDWYSAGGRWSDYADNGIFWNLDKALDNNKYHFWNVVTEEDGWVKKADMGWWGMSSLDELSDKDKAKEIKKWHKIFADVVMLHTNSNDLGKTDWVGLTYDFHI